MGFKIVILGHFLVISLALNMGLLYRDYCSGKHKNQDVFSFNNESKNAFWVTKNDAHVAERAFLETKASSSSSSSSKAVAEVIDLNQSNKLLKFDHTLNHKVLKPF